MYKFYIEEEEKGEVSTILLNSPHVGFVNIQSIDEKKYIASFECATKNETGGFKKIVSQIKKLSK